VIYVIYGYGTIGRFVASVDAPTEEDAIIFFLRSRPMLEINGIEEIRAIHWRKMVRYPDQLQKAKAVVEGMG